MRTMPPPPHPNTYAYMTLSLFHVHSVCWQLWDDLSVREHLQFYARLKGVKQQEMVAAVQQTAQKVTAAAFCWATRLFPSLRFDLTP